MVIGRDRTTGGRKATSGPTRSILYMRYKNSSHCEGVKRILYGAWMNTLPAVRSSTSISILGIQFILYPLQGTMTIRTRYMCLG